MHNILQQTSEMPGSSSGLLIKRTGNDCKKIIETGRFEDELIANEYLSELNLAIVVREQKTEQFVYFQIDKYRVIVLFDKTRSPLHQKRLYIEQASQAIINLVLDEKLMKQENLSAIGQAIGMISQDLRGLINSINYAMEMVDFDDNPEFAKEILVSLKKRITKYH